MSTFQKGQDSYQFNNYNSKQQQDNDSERHCEFRVWDEGCGKQCQLIKLVDNIEGQQMSSHQQPYQFYFLDERYNPQTPSKFLVIETKCHHIPMQICDLTSGDVDQQGEFTENQQENQYEQSILPFYSKIPTSKKAQSDDSNQDKMQMYIVLDYQESDNSKNNEINQSQQSIENSNNDEIEMPKIKIPGETKNIYKAFHGALQNFMIDMQKDLKFELCPESQKFLDIKPKTSGKGKLLKSIKSCQQMRSIAKEFFCDYQWSGYLIKNNKVELERFFRLNQIIVSSIDN